VVLATEEHSTSATDGSPAFPIRQEVPYGEGKEYYLPLVNFIVFVGMKGATKTTNLVRWGIRAQGLWNRPVYSDFPWAGDLFGVHYEPEPFPDDAFVTYFKGIKPYAVIFTDEIQEFFDRQKWQSVESQQGTSAAMQIRKLGVTIIGATQFFHYLNPRINDQVDLLIRCKDMRFTDWGWQQRIKRGREALLEYYDLCGAFDRGKSARDPRNPHWITGKPFIEELVFTEPYWRFFNTRALTAIEHRFRRYIIKKEERHIMAGDALSHLAGKDTKELATAISAIFEEHRKLGDKELKAESALSMLKNDGFTNLTENTFGKVVKRLGYKKRAISTGPDRGCTVYDLFKESANVPA